MIRDFRKRFGTSEDGSLSVEFVLIVPFLVWALGALYVYVAAFQTRETATKATYTVADLYSRQTAPIDQAFVDQTGDVLDFLARRGGRPEMRVTVLHCAADCDAETRSLEIDWSHGTASMPARTMASLTETGIEARVPNLDLGQRVIMVETRFPFTPPLGFGLGARVFDTVMLMPPRFAPQLCWETCEKSPQT